MIRDRLGFVGRSTLPRPRPPSLLPMSVATKHVQYSTTLAQKQGDGHVGGKRHVCNRHIAYCTLHDLESAISTTTQLLRKSMNGLVVSLHKWLTICG